MSYQVFLQEPAELDLEDAYNWYEDRSQGLGSEFMLDEIPSNGREEFKE
jgi:hypothetical protein